VALARAVALDPMLTMYDEPFAGLDPISLDAIANIIRRLSDAMGLTSVVVSYDVAEALKIASTTPSSSTTASWSPKARWSEMQAIPTTPSCTSSCTARRTARCSFHFPARALAQDFGLADTQR
jgi:phospholipid/cholesterol/gamma-HCH transport system ATP-binding protein